MSQLLYLVKQIHSNDGVTNINYGTLRMTERFVADADPQNISQSPIAGVLGYYILIIFSLLMTQHVYNIDETKAVG